MSQSSAFEMENGKTLRRWTDQQGREWACTAYDHGPFCRRCQPVDELLHAILDGVEEGLMLADQDPDTAEFRFKITDKGNARAEDLIHNNPEHAALWADLQRHHAELGEAFGSDTTPHRPKLNEVEENVLRALSEAGGEATPDALAEATGYTKGQVQGALSTLAEVGFIG